MRYAAQREKYLRDTARPNGKTVQASKFELVINAQAARIRGLTVCNTLRFVIHFLRVAEADRRNLSFWLQAFPKTSPMTCGSRD